MTNPRASGKRPTDWGEFYKNGQPKEVIVIDDDTPPPSTLPQSSSSRYMPTHANNSHGSTSYSMSSQIPVPTSSGRVTRRTNKRLPSTDLSPNGSIVPRPQANSQYTYQATPIYPSRNQQHLATSSAYSNNGVNSLPGPGTTCDVPPAKKKRKSNAGLKYPAPSTNYPPTYTAPSTSALARDVQDPSNDWDDKDGHFIVHVGKEFTGRYEIVKLLGQGTFGKVVECKDLETGNRCAIKIIRAVQKYRDASKIEARVLSTLKQHDPRNEYKCLHLNDMFDFKNHICMVFDLLGQSIYDWLKDNNFCAFPHNHIQFFARQLLTSVSFLHRLRLIHTDLKPENILLANGAYKHAHYSKSGTKTRRILMNPEIRLIDFGSATFQDEHHSTVVSTRHYRAPEIILGMGWSYPCDIWSVGCILVEFLTGEALFQTHDNLEHLAMMQAVLGPFPEKIIRATHKSSQKYFVRGRLDFPNEETKNPSKKFVRALKPLSSFVEPPNNQASSLAFASDFIDLLRRLLCYDPAERITAAQALRHPYFSYLLNESGEVLATRKTS
ncbi:dual specificity protein kinase kns1 [Podila minutissima]|nr:dual specificity protein kinase kns1 [Podila minutissima]